VKLELDKLGTVLLASVARFGVYRHEIGQYDGAVLVKLGLAPFHELVPDVLK